VALRLRALAAGLPDGQVAAVEQVREQVTGTMATLRDLARGVFPPQLAEAGIGAAVRSHLAKTGRAARLADRVPPGVRGSREVEAALWFCVLEALQNAAKHAGCEGGGGAVRRRRPAAGRYPATAAPASTPPRPRGGAA
jgi:signal transduction histidine kinase